VGWFAQFDIIADLFLLVGCCCNLDHDSHDSWSWWFPDGVALLHMIGCCFNGMRLAVSFGSIPRVLFWIGQSTFFLGTEKHCREIGDKRRMTSMTMGLR